MKIQTHRKKGRVETDRDWSDVVISGGNLEPPGAGRDRKDRPLEPRGEPHPADTLTLDF